MRKGANDNHTDFSSNQGTTGTNEKKGGYTGKVRITKEKLCENTHGGNANALCENLIEEKGS